ncbi:UV DNA damage repair endonuclease UvsE [Sediminibacillus massiliensis]|uniref:UV DNA damage repair endonuclease UvsE n=1 Tax=Sediminibacillus massiliensis TaxID=1926277 RepID=UPI0015C32267|nr:UV DNA damage repair endonuclease UvsE [Sediminibacillus massiliensis]
MTVFRLGYVAMSKHVKNSSPSQTVTYKNFSHYADQEAAKNKLITIANSNIENSIRLLKHNKASGIFFFRLSSRLVPLATHEELNDWNYMKGIKAKLEELGDFAINNEMRVDFHPDHFVVLNSDREEILKNSVTVLQYHYKLLTGMGFDTKHRCVLHVGGTYGDKERSLERFIENWARLSVRLQQMIMLENDDKSYNAGDVLFLCEKLGIPMVFDLHHHQANHTQPNWLDSYWERIVDTWRSSDLPVKMHISSPKSDKQFRHHADYIDMKTFVEFASNVDGSVDQVDCMIEAKQKDEALFKLVEELKSLSHLEWINDSTFRFLR